jgi:phosphatidylethanolamine-binding protein (PEBP) family uncharacterized protein
MHDPDVPKTLRPDGNREHRYFFRLYALDAPMTGKTFKDRAELEAAMKGHILAQSELTGRYEKGKK